LEEVERGEGAGVRVECRRCETVERVAVELREVPIFRHDDSEVFAEIAKESQCEECCRRFRLSFNVRIELELDGLAVTDASVEFECPACEAEVSFEDIGDDSGYEKIQYDDCGADLAIEWWQWGRDIEVHTAD
jgi:hypothetical protein